jgi:glycine oxidase
MAISSPTLEGPFLIIGGGIMGLASAWELSRRGQLVSIYERDSVGSGASGVPYAALWPSAATKRGIGHERHRESLWKFADYVRRLSDAAEMPIEFGRIGRIELFTSPDRRRAAAKEAEVACREWPRFADEPTQWIASADEIRSIEPSLEPTELGGLICHATAYVKTSELIAALKAVNLRNGVSLNEECLVTDLWIDDGRVRGIISHRPVPGAAVLVTAGAWTSELCPELNEATPIIPVKGQTILVRPRNPLIQRLIKKGRTYLIPTASGEVLVGSTSEPEAGFDRVPSESARRQLFESAIEIVPGLRDAEIVRQWVGHRPQTSTRSPYVTAVDAVRGLYVAAGHFKIGIAMAPTIGEHVAQMMFGKSA